MKRKKIIVIGLICILAVVMLAACNGNGNNGNNGGDGTIGPDIDVSDLSAMEIVIMSAEVMENVTNFATTMESDMTLAFLGQVMSMSIAADMIVNFDPMKMSMTTLMEDPITGETMDIEVYVIQEGDYLVTYMNVPQLGWVKQTEPFSEYLLNQLIQTKSPHEFMKSAEIVGEETVNGMRSWKIEVAMSSEDMFEFIRSMQEDLVGLFDATMFEGMGDMTFYMWIAQEYFYQVRMVIDMTDMMHAVMSEMGVDVLKMTMSVDSFSFGTAPAVVLPEEAADATETVISL